MIRFRSAEAVISAASQVPTSHQCVKASEKSLTSTVLYQHLHGEVTMLKVRGFAGNVGATGLVSARVEMVEKTTSEPNLQKKNPASCDCLSEINCAKRCLKILHFK